VKRALVLVVLTACIPELGDRISTVDREQVIAVIVDPPEVKPGSSVNATIVVASPDGTVAGPPVTWSFCATAKLLTDNGAVGFACQSGASVRPLPDPTAASIPPDACSIFGPEIASADLRPRDPDVTGGYYQPLRAELGGGLLAFGFERLQCNLKNAPADAARDFAARYVPNTNPTLLPLHSPPIHPGDRVVFRAAWPPESAEAYVTFDPASQLVVNRREAMRVSWFASAGTFENDRTGRDEADLALTTDNTWTAPSAPGTVHLWRVLRDSRGGAAVTHDILDVR